MAATPMLAELGGYISNRIEQEKGEKALKPILILCSCIVSFNLSSNNITAFVWLCSIAGLTHYVGQDKDAEEMKSESKDFVFVAGI